MKKKSIGTVAAVLALHAMMLSGCKKEVAVANDPLIVDVSVNKVINTPVGAVAYDSLDLNNDGLAECMLHLLNAGTNKGDVEFRYKSQQIEFAIEKLTPTVVCSIYKSGDITPLSAASYRHAAYAAINNAGYLEGLKSGEGYLAFRFTTGTKYQYGWMRIVLNENFLQLNVTDYAYCLTPDKAIVVGTK
ncbi:MAG: hypothetical protein U0T84_07645 [Chitinophagales bacterium]